MTALLAALGTAWILAVAVPVLVLLAEVVAGALRPVRAPPARLAPSLPSCAVLVPAHDEADIIATTVAAVLAQLAPSARLVVVADNCSDDTAARARAAGAEVLERRDPQLRGKGHALAFGIAYLRGAPPDVVVILDADCIPAPGALDLLAITAAAQARPVQALYLMLADPGSSQRVPMRVRLAAFAWAVKNELRPLGLKRLGLPCQLMGSGMAFPWACLERASLASSHLTEDLELGLALTAAGHPPLFCPEARIESAFPHERSALDSQRRRWEHGHLSLVVAAAPGLLWRAWKLRSAALLALCADLCVPPLALLALLVLGSCGFGAWIAWIGGEGPWAQVVAAVAAITALGFTAAVLLAWWRVGRRWIGLAELLCVPWYVAGKLPVYAGFLTARQKDWVRTGRGDAHSDARSDAD